MMNNSLDELIFEHMEEEQKKDIYAYKGSVTINGKTFNRIKGRYLMTSAINSNDAYRQIRTLVAQQNNCRYRDVIIDISEISKIFEAV